MGWYIVLAIVVLAFVLAWRLDRRDRAGGGTSRRASDMTREAMRHRTTYRRRAGR